MTGSPYLPWERERFDDLLDLLGDQLAETDVRAEAWRYGIVEQRGLQERERR